MYTNEMRIAERRGVYQGMTRRALYAYAKPMAIKGFAKMTKAQMVEAIMVRYVASVDAALAYLAR